MNRKPRPSIAYHEAGHAVIAYMMDARLDFATLDRGPHVMGPHVMMAARTHSPVEHKILLFAAGPAAQSIYTRRSLEYSIFFGGRFDDEEIRALTDQPRYPHYVLARKLCRQEWHAITAVAELLLQRHNLTGDEIEAAILQAEASAA